MRCRVVLPCETQARGHSLRIVKTRLLIFLIAATTCLAQQDAPDLASLEKKASAGDAEAQIALGLAYDQGRGIAQDRRTAAEWFAKAAAQGVAEAQFNLGTMYSSGVGVRKDEAKAVEWFEKAATQGFADAQFNLANMYATGRGTEKSVVKAIGWYDKAGVQGMTRAQYNLGLLYAEGAKDEGVPPNSVKAYAWLSLAADDGDPAAKKMRDFIESKSNTKQKAVLKKFAAELSEKIKSTRGQRPYPAPSR